MGFSSSSQKSYDKNCLLLQIFLPDVFLPLVPNIYYWSINVGVGEHWATKTPRDALLPPRWSGSEDEHWPCPTSRTSRTGTTRPHCTTPQLGGLPSPSPMLAHSDNEEWKITLKRVERPTTGESAMCLWSRWHEQAGATPPLKQCLKPDQTITRDLRYHQSLVSEVSSSCLLLNGGSHIYSVVSEGLTPWESLGFLVNHHWYKFIGCIFCLWETPSLSPAWQKGARGFGKQRYLISSSTSNSTHCCTTKVIWQVR